MLRPVPGIALVGGCLVPDDVQADHALVALLEQLARLGYAFVAPSPETHRRVLAHKSRPAASSLRDIFGWSLPFGREAIPPRIFGLLSSAQMLRKEADLYRSLVRVSSIGEKLFLHSCYPTDRRDSVFFGPDTYRFVRFIQSEMAGQAPVQHVVDIGTGAGAGAVAAAARFPDARLTLTDINPLALRFARINARHAGIEIETVEGSGVDPVSDAFDLAIANPPFIIDAAKRAYRDGGGMLGSAVSLAWAAATARRLPPRGRLLLYTGSAISDGQDRLQAALQEMVPAHGCTLRYAEIDPDIFGELLDEPEYERVERIAAVGAVIEKTSSCSC